MVILVSRDRWGARPPKSRTPLDRSIQKGTAVHYSGFDGDEQASHTNCAGRVRNIQIFHMDVRGWADIAYSDLVCKHGYVFEGRGLGIRTAAQGTTSGNDSFHAVCFLGDDTAGRDDVTDPGREAIKWAVDRCNSWAGVHGVEPHSFFHATQCPGDQLRAWVAAGMPLATSPPPEDTMAFPDQDYFDGKFKRNLDDRFEKLMDPTHAYLPALHTKVDTLETQVQSMQVLLARIAFKLDVPTEPPPEPTP